MAILTNNSTENSAIERDYTDNYSIKEFVTGDLIAKYFPDIDVSLRSVGMVGMTSELVSDVAEDSFNASSVLFREIFPNRAEIPESIYSHAAIFQLEDVFSKPSVCKFIIAFEEDAILQNTTKDPDTGIYYFTLDKDFTVTVEDIPYILDYDIKIRAVQKRFDDGDMDYVYAAEYDFSGYKNSMSDLTDPFIKIRRSTNGILALEVTMRQLTRTVMYEDITSNNRINMPSIDISYTGDLAGMDILYKTMADNDYNTQLKIYPAYSQPTTTPFCYYQIFDDNVVRLTFNGKDSYFIPKYNSSIKVILYTTEGAIANFDTYDGTNIKVMLSENDSSDYDNSFIKDAAVLSSSVGGSDRLSLDALQQLTVEQYRTATALTTEPDLNFFFANYKYEYKDSNILFVKRRNDVYERVFGAYILMKRDDYIYKTNTVNIDMNLSDMKKQENNIYVIEPGTLFTYKGTDNNNITFYHDPDKYKTYYEEYQQAIKDGTIPYIIAGTSENEVPGYLKNRVASFAEFKQRKGYDDKINVYDKTQEELEALDNPDKDQYLFINPFLIRFMKSPNLVTSYMTYVNQKSMLDYTNRNTDSFVQFISSMVQIERSFISRDTYTVTTTIAPSTDIDPSYPVVNYTPYTVTTESGEEDTKYDFGTRFDVIKNDLRVLFIIYNGTRPICYSEMHPTDFVTTNNVIRFKTTFKTDNYITSDGRLRLLSGLIYRNYDTGEYYKVHSKDATKYGHYDKNDKLLEDNIPVDDVTALIKAGTIKKYCEVVNMTGNDEIIIPIEDVTCKIYSMYRRVYSTEAAKLIPTTHEQTNNAFVNYDSTYDTYIWSTEYSTSSEPLTFLKSLTNVRSNLYFKDFMIQDPKTKEYVNDIMDVSLESVPLVRWNLAYQDDYMTYFMNNFLAHYEIIDNIIYNRLRNETSIDIKLYNTYGRSTNYLIGEDGTEVLNTINLKIAFDIWFVDGTDLLTAVPKIKSYIKTKIETLNNETGTNQLHISNLMRLIESNFAFVDHIRFRGINQYSTDYQSIRLIYADINTMPKELRQKYVPEMLVVDTDDITINEYTMTY